MQYEEKQQLGKRQLDERHCTQIETGCKIVPKSQIVILGPLQTHIDFFTIANEEEIIIIDKLRDFMSCDLIGRTRPCSWKLINSDSYLLCFFICL